jgi:hypothetical protein
MLQSDMAEFSLLEVYNGKYFCFVFCTLLRHLMDGMSVRGGGMSKIDEYSMGMNANLKKSKQLHIYIYIQSCTKE